jgi:hypothetical protein
MKFDDVGLSGKPEPQRPQAESTRDPDRGATLRAALVCPVVQNAALCSQPVLLPLLLDLNQPPLPLTKHQVLQAGEGEEIILRVHYASE